MDGGYQDIRGSGYQGSRISGYQNIRGTGYQDYIFHGNKFPIPERQGNSGQLEADYQGISRISRGSKGCNCSKLGLALVYLKTWTPLTFILSPL